MFWDSSCTHLLTVASFSQTKANLDAFIKAAWEREHWLLIHYENPDKTLYKGDPEEDLNFLFNFLHNQMQPERHLVEESRSFLQASFAFPVITLIW